MDGDNTSCAAAGRLASLKKKMTFHAAAAAAGSLPVRQRAHRLIFFGSKKSNHRPLPHIIFGRLPTNEEEKEKTDRTYPSLHSSESLAIINHPLARSSNIVRIQLF